MPKPKTSTGEKNLISQRLIELRRQHNMSQRLLAYQLQLNGYDMDKNVITRIETNKRYVTDVELKALTEIFNVSYEFPSGRNFTTIYSPAFNVNFELFHMRISFSTTPSAESNFV